MARKSLRLGWSIEPITRRFVAAIEQFVQDNAHSETFQQINRPRQVASSRRNVPPPLRFGDPKVQALWSALLMFTWLPTGFSNRNLREHFTSLLGLTMYELGCGQMTYQLRRLRLHGFIERIPQSHRYRITDFGPRRALFFTRTYARILRPGLAQAPTRNTLRQQLSAQLLRSFNKLQQRSIRVSVPPNVPPKT